MWHYAVPYRWCNGVLAGFLSEGRILVGSNLMSKVRIIGWMWQHCPFKISDDGLCGMPTCVLLSVSWRSDTSNMFLVYVVDEGEHSDFLVFQHGSWSSLLFTWPEVAKNNTFCYLNRL